MKNLFYYTFFIAIVAITLSIFRPVPIVKESEALTKKGIITYVFEAGIKDVVFRIADTETTYYINRGLENGLNLKELKEKLMGKEVTIKYPKYWTPLDWDNKIRHLSKLEFEGEVIFNEL